MGIRESDLALELAKIYITKLELVPTGVSNSDWVAINAINTARALMVRIGGTDSKLERQKTEIENAVERLNQAFRRLKLDEWFNAVNGADRLFISAYIADRVRCFQIEFPGNIIVGVTQKTEMTIEDMVKLIEDNVVN